MCNCQTVCRLPDIETEDWRWPMSDHAPCCEEYKLIKYRRISYEGSFFIATVQDAEDFMKDAQEHEESNDYVHEDVYLTRDQFEKLEEFTGF